MFSWIVATLTCPLHDITVQVYPIEHLLNHTLVVQVKDLVELPLGAAVPMGGVSPEIVIKCRN